MREFTLTACAVELGLEAPGHPQGGDPLAPKARAKGLDLNESQCDSLITYLRELPAPRERRASDESEAKILATGKAAFSQIGCASCHTAKVGDVDGIYGDLLLHDMGPELSDVGQYGQFSPGSPGEPPPTPTQPEGPLVQAGRQEWRTAPLWGFRDSGPYLHDGRAQTLDQAIALHGGQGEPSSRAYFALKANERMALQMFLKSLVAPEPLELANVGR